MAAKAHLRNDKPVIIGISTNDGLGINMKNIGSLLNMKNMYFVPFWQDDHINKTKSLVAHSDLLIKTIEMALEGKQLQPVIISPFK
jgi:dipicolinate synthase subunit B